MIKGKIDEILNDYIDKILIKIRDFVSRIQKMEDFIFKNDYLLIEHDFNQIEECMEKKTDYKESLSKMKLINEKIDSYKNKNK